MRVLLDECVPVQVQNALPDHEVATVGGMGWKGRDNGELLLAAERAGFDVLMVADKSLRYQQNLASRALAIVELWTNHRPTLERHFPHTAEHVRRIKPGEYVIVPPPGA